jgi:large subunit ribosomal protein L24
MSNFTTTWKGSTQPRKQRKYRYNAPLHVRQKFVHVHLSAELRKKYGFRNVQVRSGDKVKVMRGSNKGKEGKVERVSLKYEKVYVTGFENIKKDGSKTMIPFAPSNLMITILTVDDKKRKQKLESKSVKTEPKKENKGEKNEESS